MMGERQPVARRRWRALDRILAAHGVMLRDAELIDDGALATLLRAVEQVGGGAAPIAPLARMVADFDERVDAQSPAGMTGIARLGRGTPETIATVARLLVRDDLVRVARAMDALRADLIDLARTHVVTLMPTAIDGQIAQPTTYAHWLGATIGPLGRLAIRLCAVVDEVDRSPMGSGAAMSSPLPIDRERAAGLLGFGGVIHNTYDAVTANDWVVSVADALVAAASTVRRLVDELLAWLRAEPASFRLSDAAYGYVTDLPQLKAPSSLVELAARSARLAAAARAISAESGSLPLSPGLSGLDPVVDGLDDALAAVTTVLDDARELVTEMEVNRALLANRAGKGFATSSDLAEFLMLEEQIEPGPARAIAALTISRARDQGLEAAGITVDLIDGAALLVLGREIKPEFEAISRYLAPRRFVERRTATGAPSPASTRAYLEVEAAALEADRARLTAVSERVDGADRELERLRSEVLAAAES